MKKNVLFLYFFLIFCTAKAQHYLIPFQNNNSWGLLTNKGEVVVKAEYDFMLWQEDKYFTALKFNDGYEYGNGQPRYLSTLFYDTTQVIKNEIFQQFSVKANKYILAHSEMSFLSPKYYVDLLDISGKNLSHKKYKSLYDVGFLKSKLNYVVFYALDSNDKKSIFTYDVRNKKVQDYLIENVNQLDYELLGENIVRISYTDSKQARQTFYIQACGSNYCKVKELKKDNQMNTLSDTRQEPVSAIISSKGIKKQDGVNLKNYDSVFKIANYEYDMESNKLKLGKSEKKEMFFYNDVFCGFKNGKVMLLNNAGEVLIDKFDEIGSPPKGILGAGTAWTRTDFYIVKSNGLYGIIYFEYYSNTEKLIYTKPIFKYIPLFYFEDYFGIKNFRLYGIFNSNEKQIGFANEKGDEFIK